MDRKLLSLYGLKYNPFSQDVPIEALYLSPRIEHFLWRVEHLAREGGFAATWGNPGEGKSVTLRFLEHRLSRQADLKVGILTRPQCIVADLYRELGDLYGVKLTPHNRWAGAQVLRARWLDAIEQSHYRPVLLIDEAQETLSPVFNEIRLLTSACLDSKTLLTVVLAGDHRLASRFRNDDLLSLGSRMRVRLVFEPASVDELAACLEHRVVAAGNPNLLTQELSQTLCQHAAGNYRVLLTMADQLLAEAAQRELPQIDEKLYLQVFAVPGPPMSSKANSTARRRP